MTKEDWGATKHTLQTIWRKAEGEAWRKSENWTFKPTSIYFNSSAKKRTFYVSMNPFASSLPLRSATFLSLLHVLALFFTPSKWLKEMFMKWRRRPCKLSVLEDKTRQSEEKKGLKREWCCNEENVWEEGELGIEKDAKKIE
jgi:hypothetical protein